AMRVALGVEQVVVECRRGEDLALLSRHRLQDASVYVAERFGDTLALRARDKRRQLEQLEIPHDGMRDIEVGVEAKLAEPTTGPGGALEQLVAEQSVGRVERLSR